MCFKAVFLYIADPTYGPNCSCEGNTVYDFQQIDNIFLFTQSKYIYVKRRVNTKGNVSDE